MNPFKYNRATFTSGFYFDFKKRCICYLDTEGDEENPYSGNETTYNRFTGSEGYSVPFLPMPKGNRQSKGSAIEDLVHLSYLDNYKVDKELDKDFDWIYGTEAVKEQFHSYLLNEELYSLLYLFNSFISEKELTPEEKERRRQEKLKADMANYISELDSDGVLFIKFPDSQ